MRMNHQGPISRETRPTNVTLRTALVNEAKELGINISAAASAGLEQAVAVEKAERWIRENGPALGSYNEFVSERGLPLANLRIF
jgi:antitoxin CcdA